MENKQPQPQNEIPNPKERVGGLGNKTGEVKKTEYEDRTEWLIQFACGDQILVRKGKRKGSRWQVFEIKNGELEKMDRLWTLYYAQIVELWEELEDIKRKVLEVIKG